MASTTTTRLVELHGKVSTVLHGRLFDGVHMVEASAYTSHGKPSQQPGKAHGNKEQASHGCEGW